MYNLYFASDVRFCHARAVPVCCINYHFVQVLLSCPSKHRGCTGALERTLQQVLQVAVRKIISLPRSDQLRSTCITRDKFSSVCTGLLTHQQQLTAGGSLGDTINGPDRFVYCEWRRLYAVCSKLCGVSLCL